MLDIDRHRETPAWVRNMGWSSVYTILTFTTLESNMSLVLVLFMPHAAWAGIFVQSHDWMRCSVRFSSSPTRGSCPWSAVSDRLTI